MPLLEISHYFVQEGLTLMCSLLPTVPIQRLSLSEDVVCAARYTVVQNGAEKRCASVQNLRQKYDARRNSSGKIAYYYF